MTVAALLQAVLLALVCVASATVSILSYLGYPTLGVVSAIASLFGYALVLAIEFVCLWCVEPQAARPTFRGLTSAWAMEAFITPAIFCWRQPFRSRSIDDLLPSVFDGRRGVLLIHGLLCNRGFWTPWMTRLGGAGCPYMAINLEPAFASIDDYVQAIDIAVARLESSTGMSPVIVAHSMGGLAVRRWLCSRHAAQRVHRVITIGTPHRGTWLARFSRSASGREMAIGSRWLRVLASDESKTGFANFTCFYGNCDNVVFPSTNATLPGADNRRVDGAAHVAMAFKPEVYAEVLRYLGSASATPAT